MLTLDWSVCGRVLTSTVPIRLVVPGVSVIETAAARGDAVGIRRRMLAKRINSTRLFFMKTVPYSVSDLTVPEYLIIGVVVRVLLCVFIAEPDVDFRIVILSSSDSYSVSVISMGETAGFVSLTRFSIMTGSIGSERLNRNIFE